MDDAMKTLHYQGFTGKPCSCEYAIGRLGDKTAVVFVQGPLNQTSITNLIEVLASKVLCTDLTGTQPANVRFFEHYPPTLQPIVAWQEVVLRATSLLPKPGGLMAKFLGLFAGESGPDLWVVDEPVWGPIPPADLVAVQALKSSRPAV